MTTEFLDLEKDPESFVASLDRKPKSLAKVILEEVFSKLTKAGSWDEPQQEKVDSSSINIE